MCAMKRFKNRDTKSDHAELLSLSTRYIEATGLFFFYFMAQQGTQNTPFVKRSVLF